MSLPSHSTPLPHIRFETSAFWTGGERGALLIYHCADCKHFHHPPLPICPECQSDKVAPRQVSGRGKVVSFTINHHPWRPDMTKPFVIAYVAIEEQANIWILSNIINMPPSSVSIDMEVRVIFFQREDVWFPLFEPIVL